uniref:Uncharacterized protein n=1 Tax=Trichuris muris TaxID=70415 RepID=A0A5S6QBQ7_TRIMR
MLYQDFSVRYEDILGMEIPSWVIDPFADVDDAELRFQEELMELQTNAELIVKFKDGYQAFWMQRRIAESYPSQWGVVSSTVMNLLTKKRNRLQIATRGDLRLRLANMNPNVSKLVSPRQSQSSH